MVSCITCYMQGIHMSVFSSVCLSVWVGLCSLKDEFGQTCSKDTSDSSLAGVRLDCYLVSDFITLATQKSASFSIKVLQSCSTPQAQVLTHADIRHLGALPYVFTGWIRAPPCFDSLDGFPKPLWHCRNYHLRYSFFSEGVSAKFFLHWSLQPALEAGSEITASLQIQLWSMNKDGNKGATYPLTSMSECPVCDSKLSYILCGKRSWKVRLSKYPVSCPVVCTEPVCRLGELSCVACLEDREKYREPSEAYDAW